MSIIRTIYGNTSAHCWSKCCALFLSDALAAVPKRDRLPFTTV
jgi:hypothetical protein